jgi:hypothetical protein
MKIVETGGPPVFACCHVAADRLASASNAQRFSCDRCKSEFIAVDGVWRVDIPAMAKRLGYTWPPGPSAASPPVSRALKARGLLAMSAFFKLLANAMWRHTKKR